MTTAAAVVLALAAAAGPLMAQPDVKGADVENADTAEVRSFQSRLRSDAASAEALVRRIFVSTLVDRISRSESAAERLEAIRDWIKANPETAAEVGVGLKRDDAAGDHRYEERMRHRLTTRLEGNAASTKGSYGRLRASATSSLLLEKEQELKEEERRERFRDFFDGRGGMEGKVLTHKDREAAKPETSDKGAVGTAGFSAAGFYDRLSRINIKGYSQDVLALQSQLNRRRPPGAPALAETGRLDHATLGFPRHGIRYDIANLKKRGAPAQAVALAEAALADFEAAAERARNPASIGPELLAELGRLQREAARWIAVADLEDAARRLEDDEGFFSSEIRAAIDASGAEPGLRAAYLQRGLQLKSRLEETGERADRTIALLKSDAWLTRLGEIERERGRVRASQRALARQIPHWTGVAAQVGARRAPKPRWKAWLERIVRRLRPHGAWSHRLNAEKEATLRSRQAFARIAAGELEPPSEGFPAR